MNKNIPRITISIICGILLSLFSLLVVISDNCTPNIDTCGANVGFPFAVFSGPSYAKSFNGYEVLTLNTIFWIFISIVIFLLVIPLFRKYLLRKQK